jgi:hypothetical protein
MRPVFYRNPEQERRWMCERKKKFKTAREAQAANPSHRPYLCPFCDHYHLTHLKKKRKKYPKPQDA